MAEKQKKRLTAALRKNRGNIRWLLRQAKGVKGYMAVFLAISLISMVVSLASTIVSKYVVDAATGFHTGFFYRYILIMAVTSVCAILFSAGAGVFSGYAGERYAFSIRARMFDRVQRSQWQQVAKYHSGDILARLTSDIATVASGILQMSAAILTTLLQLAIVLVILLRYDPLLALLGLIIGPLGVAGAVVCRKRYSKYQRLLKESESEYYAFFQEHISNLSLVKTFQLEGRNQAHLENIRRRRLKLITSSTLLSSSMNALMRLIYSLGYVLAFSYCAYRLSDGSGYTYGTMTLFLALVSQLQNTIRSLGSFVTQLYSMVVSAGRVREITELTQEQDAEDGPIPPEVSVQVEDVSFGYGRQTVLSHLTLFVPAGTRVGVVGGSGVGKTTFIRLLLSLVEPTQGQILFAGEGLSQRASPSTRRLIAYVPQGNTLLSGTVRENLLLACPQATEEQLWQALEMADAKTFLQATPLGLDTLLGEKADGLSEGQSQRISIARALLRDRPVLILDEATSALDEATEARVLQRISQNCHKTCFIITHRPSMLAYCDWRMEIGEDGRATIAPLEKNEERCKP